MRVNLFYFAVILLFTNNTAEAQNKSEIDDAKAYCAYVSKKAQADVITLRAPEVQLRVDNANSDAQGSQTRAIAALSKDLVDVNKSRYVSQFAKDECEVYRLNLKIHNLAQYGILAVEEQVLNHKKQLLLSAFNQLQKQLEQVNQQVKSQNATLVEQYNAKGMIRKIENMMHQNDQEIASIRRKSLWPQGESLNDLINQVRLAEIARQNTLNQIEKQNNWSLQVQAGAKQTLSSSSGLNSESKKVEPFFSINARYNLGSWASERVLDESAKDYVSWKSKQMNGVSQELAVFVNSAIQLKEVEERNLSKLSSRVDDDMGLTALLNQSGSTEAEAFKTVIDANQVVNLIEKESLSYKVKLLEDLIRNAGLNG